MADMLCALMAIYFALSSRKILRLGGRSMPDVASPAVPMVIACGGPTPRNPMATFSPHGPSSLGKREVRSPPKMNRVDTRTDPSWWPDLGTTFLARPPPQS